MLPTSLRVFKFLLLLLESSQQISKTAKTCKKMLPSLPTGLPPLLLTQLLLPPSLPPTLSRTSQQSSKTSTSLPPTLLRTTTTPLVRTSPMLLPKSSEPSQSHTKLKKSNIPTGLCGGEQLFCNTLQITLLNTW